MAVSRLVLVVVAIEVRHLLGQGCPGGLPGRVGERPLLRRVRGPPLPGTGSCRGPLPPTGGGGGGGGGCPRPAAVGVVGTSGWAGSSSAPGTAVPSWRMILTMLMSSSESASRDRPAVTWPGSWLSWLARV